MSSRAYALLDRARQGVDRDGRLARVLEPLVRWTFFERGLLRPTVAQVRAGGLEVRDGPFAGMTYPAGAAIHVPGLAWRLAGTYEAELHPAVERLIGLDPDAIVNVGAADGFYAVGMAIRCPAASTIAFERDPYYARLCTALARRNGVEGRLELRGECTANALRATTPGERTVVVCDCEGAERELIDPAAIEWQAAAAMLIEVHESFDPGLTEELRGRLAATHDVEVIEPGQRYLEDHPEIWGLPGLSLVQRESLVHELRPWRTPWLLALPSS